MKSRAERFVIPALAFVLPGVVMLWVYAALGVAPFGDRTVLLSDMSSQYVEFFCALKNGEVFFSWSKALGTGYIGVFSYYVSSPLSLLTLLAPNEELPAALAVLTALKIALAGLSFALFAQRRFPDCGWGALLGAVCYALMSYNAAYSICIMWLDGVIWLPLILLALERIVAGRGGGPSSRPWPSASAPRGTSPIWWAGSARCTCAPGSSPWGRSGGRWGGFWPGFSAGRPAPWL